MYCFRPNILFKNWLYCSIYCSCTVQIFGLVGVSDYRMILCTSFSLQKNQFLASSVIGPDFHSYRMIFLASSKIFPIFT